MVGVVFDAAVIEAINLSSFTCDYAIAEAAFGLSC